MSQELNVNQAPTGKVYRGKGIRLTAEVETLKSLVQFSNYIRGRTKSYFVNKYGNILDLLHVPVHCEALVELGQYWDASLRCFTFFDFQMAPTIEEYGEILRMPFKSNNQIYHYPGHLPTKRGVAKLLGVQLKEVETVCPGKVDGISRTFVEKQLTNLANMQNWTVFCRVFALAIYGIVIFPSSKGIIDLSAISVFHMVENYQINPVPAILADTYMSLSHCHIKKGKKGAKIRCCLALLDIWMLSHVYGMKLHFRKMHDEDTNPLTAFNHLEDVNMMNQDGWKTVFSRLVESSLLWKVDWWYDDRVIFCCGDFHNVPLVGPRGCINYNPSLALRQLAFLQRVPSEEEVHAIHFFHENDDVKVLSQRIKKAWSNIIYKGRIELGKRQRGATQDYKDWLKKRIEGANPVYAPQDPLLGNDVQGINRELAKRLEMREKELEKLVGVDFQNKEKMSQLQNECDTLQEKLTEKRKRRDLEENSRAMEMKRENESLKRVMREKDRQIRDNKVQLMKMTSEKEALEKKLQDNGCFKELQQEVDTLTQLLEKKKNELVVVKGNAAEMIENLMNKLNQEREVLANCEALCHLQIDETKTWVKRCGDLINFANAKIPEFVGIFKRADCMINPLNPPREITEFFNLCGQIIDELKSLTKF